MYDAVNNVFAWEQYTRDLPSSVIALLNKMMAYRLKDRHQDTAALLQAIKQVKARISSFDPWRRRKLLVLLAGTGLGSVWLWEYLKPKPTITPPIPKPTPSPTVTDSPTATPELTPTPSFRNFTLNLPNNQTMPMIAVQGGTFTIGSPKGVGSDNEQPQTQITVSNFYLSQYEVTNAQWFALMGDYEGSKAYGETFRERYAALESKFKGNDQPIVVVDWNDAKEYCRRLSQATGKQCRLPTEAEWEYAAKGGTQTRGYTYAGSNNLDEVGWYNKNSGNVTHPVGQKKANELGLYDMSGNVWEWCEDNYHNTYNGIPQDGSAWNVGGETNQKVVRGGSWNDFVQFCRSAIRDGDFLGNRNGNFGFRFVSFSDSSPL
jgi:formylglycine-generating enzyme required for sulfatase activity